MPALYKWKYTGLLTGLFMIMEVTDEFNFAQEGCGGCRQSKGAGMGAADVEISTGYTGKQAG